VAAGLFRSKGYAGTTTRELADALGIRNASLYHHIGTKEDLLFRLSVAALDQIYTRVLSATKKAAPEAKVVTLIKTHLMAALEDHDAHATMLAELRSLSPKPRRVVQQKRDRYESLVRRIIGDAQAAGLLRQDISTKYLGLSLLNLLNWSIFWYQPAGELTPEGLADLLTQIYLDGSRQR
jgi:AcrR family transcriptional regulator